MDLAGKHVLIIGGAGFIGSHLVDQLCDLQLRIVDDLSTGQISNIEHRIAKPNVEFQQTDIADTSAIASAMKGIDVVFHLACRNVRHSIGHPRENHDVNATATLEILRAARAANVTRFVYVSSSEVYGTARRVPMDEEHPCFPETVYGASKLAGECYTRAFHQTYQLPTVVVRPFNNFGPRSHFEGDSGEVIPRFAVWAINRIQPVIFGDGQQTRDFIYVEETAHWLRKIVECDALVGQTINLCSGRETSVRQLAEMIYDEAGCPELEPQHVTDRPGDVRRHCGDATQARDALGLELQIDIREGIRRLFSHLRSLPTPPDQLLQQIGQTNW